MSAKRHKYRNGIPTATYGDLSYKEQKQSINMTELNLKKKKNANKRKSDKKRGKQDER